MSFLPAVRREVSSRDPVDPVRIALEILLAHAVGVENAMPLDTLVTELNGRGVAISGTGFQQTVLAESRDRDYFIGSSNRGYFLIDTIADARTMHQFYTSRIAAETQNLDNLIRQARNAGWVL